MPWIATTKQQGTAAAPQAAAKWMPNGIAAVLAFFWGRPLK